MTTAMQTIIIGSAAFSFIVSVLFQESIGTLLGALKHFQVLLHIILFEAFCTKAGAEVFTKGIISIASFAVYDFGPFLTDRFNIEEGEAPNIHFEAIGFASSDFILNTGSIFVSICVAPLYILLLLLIIYGFGFCSKVISKYAQKQLNATFFNGIIAFMDGVILVVATAACINIEHRDKAHASFE